MSRSLSSQFSLGKFFCEILESTPLCRDADEICSPALGWWLPSNFSIARTAQAHSAFKIYVFLSLALALLRPSDVASVAAAPTGTLTSSINSRGNLSGSMPNSESATLVMERRQLSTAEPQQQETEQKIGTGIIVTATIVGILLLIFITSLAAYFRKRVKTETPQMAVERLRSQMGLQEQMRFNHRNYYGSNFSNSLATSRIATRTNTGTRSRDPDGIPIIPPPAYMPNASPPKYEDDGLEREDQIPIRDPPREADRAVTFDAPPEMLQTNSNTVSRRDSEIVRGSAVSVRSSH
ncbi:hypothetical protein SCHPADRAFT_910290, partial [Schizopora paradoxa]